MRLCCSIAPEDVLLKVQITSHGSNNLSENLSKPKPVTALSIDCAASKKEPEAGRQRAFK